jgi:hypothetical protein
MKRKCHRCHLVNFESSDACSRCQADLGSVVQGTEPKPGFLRWILVRSGVIAVVCIVITLGFYLSLIASAKPLDLEQKETVNRAMQLLRESAFETEAMFLSRFTAFRRDDHWLNAAVPKENAYAATNFPFQIMTLYADFFAYPEDDVEKAAILLHEARHLMGEGEKEAYEYVWKNKARLGWTKENYPVSEVWLNVREQTREHAPDLFICTEKPLGDCTE